MNDILTERAACAKIADHIARGHFGGARKAVEGVATAIRARSAPKPVITDEMVERAARGIVSLRAVTQWDDMKDNMKDLYLEEARAALVAALGGK